LEEAIKASFEEDKIYQSHKDTQIILHNKSNNNSINKYHKNCKRNNDSTNECRYARRTLDTGQKNNTRQTTQSTSIIYIYCTLPTMTIVKHNERKLSKLLRKILNVNFISKHRTLT